MLHRSLLALLALLVASLTPAAQEGAEPLLYERPAFLSPDDPRAVAFGDLDGDGRLDAVVADVSTDGLQVRLQTGPRAFTPPVLLEAGQAFEDVALSDLDADGHLDLVAVDGDASASVHVLLGDGAGGFGAPLLLPLGGKATAVRAVDLDADGDADLLSAISDLGLVGVHLGNGDGTFAALVTHLADVGVQDIAVGDLDGDLDLDVVTANGLTASVAILLGDGSGSFSAPVLRAALSPCGVRLVDVDRDGDLDLVTASLVTDDIAVLTNQGGTFGGFDQYPIIAPAYSLDVADVDGDGITDVVVGYGRVGVDTSIVEFSFVIGDGAGGFALGPGFGNSSDADTTTVLVLDDVDGDGALDVTTGLPLRNATVVHYGDGAGGLETPRTVPIGPQPRALRAADVNGDAITDLIVANNGGQGGPPGSLMTLLGDGTGGFLPPIVLVSNLDDLELADLDHDGVPDAIVHPQNTTQVCTAVSTGTGTFVSTGCVNVQFAPTDFEPGDFDGDGNVDVAVIGYYAGAVRLLLGDGTGALVHGESSVDLGGNPYSLAAVDLDQDGDLDLVVAENGVLITLRNDGTGDLSTRVDFPFPGANGRSVAATDLDRDGLPDLIFDGGAVLHVLPGTGGGSFGAPRSFFVGQADSLVVADANRDGFPDVFAEGQGLFSVALNDGAGFFAPRVVASEAKLFPRDVDVADLDGDGWPEVIEVDSANRAFLFDNLAPGTARTIVRNGSGTNPLVYASTSPPLLGESWTASVDASLQPAATATVVIATDLGISALPTPFGELLVAVAPPGNLVGSSLQPVVDGSSDHAFPIPDDAALIGTFVATQAALLGGGAVLTNALDVVLGDS